MPLANHHVGVGRCLLLLVLQLAVFFFSPTTSTQQQSIAWTIPDTKSPDTLPLSLNSPSNVTATDLSSLPSRIFVIDGDQGHMSTILNCFASLVRFSDIDPLKIYVLTYNPSITSELNEVPGISTIYRPDWLDEAATLEEMFRGCKVGGSPMLGGSALYMKMRLFLEMAHREVKFMMLDSSTIFKSSPQIVMNADRWYTLPEGEDHLTLEESIDGIMYGSAGVSEGSMLHWTNFQKTKGKFAVDSTPGVYLNPKMLLPLWKANMEVGLKLWSGCVRGWWRVGMSGLLFKIGLRWEQVPDRHDGWNTAVYRSTWEEVPYSSHNITNPHRKKFPTPLELIDGLMEPAFFFGTCANVFSTIATYCYRNRPGLCHASTSLSCCWGAKKERTNDAECWSMVFAKGVGGLR